MRAGGPLQAIYDHLLQREITREGLTDGWNYVKVVVGSNLRAEVRMKSGHSFWAKNQEVKETIDLDGPFNKYWNSNDHEFTVLSQSLSLIGPRTSD